MEKRIEHLSLAGGGLKGVAYLGAFKAMIDLNLWDDVISISGSSAGSIAALVGSTGWKYKKMLKVFSSINFKALLTTDSNYADVPYVGGMIETLTDPINLASNLLSRFAIHSHKRLLDAVEKIVSEVSGLDKCTFEEWHSIKTSNPSLRMKDIVCAAGNLNTGFNDFFAWNIESTKRVPISLAITASCAFPFYLEPVLINKMYYADCGIANNTPEEIFSTSPGVVNPNVLGLVLTSNPEGYMSLNHKPEREIGSIIDYINGVISLVKNTQHYNYMHSGYVPHTAFINTFGMGTFDFVTFEKMKEKLIDSGYSSVLDYVSVQIEPHKKRIEIRTSKITVTEISEM